MKLKKLLSILLTSLIIMSSLSVINVFAQTDNNQTEITDTTETTDSTSEPTTEPTTEATEPSTEVTETTAPTAETTAPTVTEENVTFTVDEGVCARYDRVAFYDDYLYIIYIYDSTDYLYNAGEISVKVNGENIKSLKEDTISTNPTITTYKFYAKADDKVDIAVPKGSIKKDKRFEFIYDDYLISNNIEGDYSVRVNQQTNIAYCTVRFAIDMEHGVDAHFYLDDVEITDVAVNNYESLNGYNCYTYTFSVGPQDKVVVKATSYAVEPTPTTEPTEPTKPTPAVEKKANPVKVIVKNTSVSAKKLESKKQTVKPITVKDAKGTVEVVTVKAGTASKIYKKITVNKKTGAITFSKGKYSKKTYNIMLKITAKGNSEYKSKVIVKTVKVNVK